MEKKNFKYEVPSLRSNSSCNAYCETGSAASNTANTPYGGYVNMNDEASMEALLGLVTCMPGSGNTTGDYTFTDSDGGIHTWGVPGTSCSNGPSAS